MVPATVERWNVLPVVAVNEMRSAQVDPEVECWTLTVAVVTFRSETTWRWARPPPVDPPDAVVPWKVTPAPEPVEVEVL